jgi:DNA-directed RNA polymerase beta' subunit
VVDTTNFDQLRIGLASPDEIRRLSHGEVKKPETINYRTFKPEPDGLFCERIFGPTRDWECHCGKYRKIKFRGITCDRCGVEVTRAKVRRERMGHIDLAVPVSHIWYLKGMPSAMSLLLDISARPLEKVIYFASYIVGHVEIERVLDNLAVIRQTVEEEIADLNVQREEALAELAVRREKDLKDRDEEFTDEDRTALLASFDARIKEEDRLYQERRDDVENGLRLLLGQKLDFNPGLAKKQLISEVQYRSLGRLGEVLSRRGGKRLDGLFSAGLGAEAIRDLLREIDLEELSRELRKEITETGGPRRARSIKRLEVVEAFRRSRNRPEWMILEVVPVIPPELRPMVQLDGGRFATSDLNDLYRRIINRNNRLKKIKELQAPESIVNHEKRLLQEAVDALIDNSRRARPVTGSNDRPLKSLSDMLKGKEGRFRKNLLGKRVDYSGRSVIVVGPHLRLHECGLPREMALELFKPFVMKRLVDLGVATNVKTAKKMVDRMDRRVWDALEEVTHKHPVMINRAPTLHRLGIQAFEPVLVDGKAIQIHPLVCPAFNADFDGDQMAVHVPLSTSAQAEARILMRSTENLFSPRDGKPIVTPIRDIILGCYYMTQKRVGAKGAGKAFANPQEAVLAFDSGHIDLHADIRVRAEGAMLNTTVGRLIFNEVLPPKLRYLDRVVDKPELDRIISDCYAHYGSNRTVELLDAIKLMGFHYSTLAGITLSMTDMDIPGAGRDAIIAQTEAEVRKTNDHYSLGLITAGERADKICQLWTQAADNVQKGILNHIDPFNPLFMMAHSGARGSLRQIGQITGMRGLMADPFGRFIEDLPIKSNFHEGLNILEYFVSTHGARKGLADTALRTADAGYLTRRLVDVSQDVIVRSEDCGTSNGMWLSAIREDDEEIETLTARIDGRIVAADTFDPRNDRLVIKAGKEINPNDDPPCPNCGGDFVTLFQCQACDQVVDEEELSRVYHAKLFPSDNSISFVVEQPTISDEEVEELPVDMGVDNEDTVQAEGDESEATLDESALLMGGVKADDEHAGETELATGGIPVVPMGILEEMPCPHCEAQGESGQLQALKICADCDSQFVAGQLVSPLATMRRIVEECEAFYAAVDALVAGEHATQDIADPFTEEVILEKGKSISATKIVKLKDLVRELKDRGGLAVGQVYVRSPLTCELRQGICAACYGRDMSTGRQVEVGEAVGIIAAESIGEPGTQLTMRTFHTGGVAGQYLTGVADVKKRRQETLRELHEDISRGLVDFEQEDTSERERVSKIQQMLKVLEEQVKGLLRVVELFEARRPKGQAIVSESDGFVAAIETSGVRWIIVHSEIRVDAKHPETLEGQVTAEEIRNPKNDEVLVPEGKELNANLLAKLVTAKVKNVKVQKRYMVPYRGYLRVKEGDVLNQGDSLTEGPQDPQKVLAMKGVNGVQDYLVREIQKVYRSYGVDINDKHTEVIVRQMLRKNRVVDSGDTELLPGKIYDRFHFDEVNRQIVSRGGRPATAERVLLGITEASLGTDSFLSAASFQKATRVLTEAAINGKTDYLVGLKENVIIGRLIPAGTGMATYRNIRVQGPAGEPAPFAAAAARARAELLAQNRDMGIAASAFQNLALRPDEELEGDGAEGDFEGPPEPESAI